MNYTSDILEAVTTAGFNAGNFDQVLKQNSIIKRLDFYPAFPFIKARRVQDASAAWANSQHLKNFERKLNPLHSTRVAF